MYVWVWLNHTWAKNAEPTVRLKNHNLPPPPPPPSSSSPPPLSTPLPTLDILRTFLCGYQSIPYVANIHWQGGRSLPGEEETRDASTRLRHYRPGLQKHAPGQRRPVHPLHVSYYWIECVGGGGNMSLFMVEEGRGRVKGSGGSEGVSCTWQCGFKFTGQGNCILYALLVVLYYKWLCSYYCCTYMYIQLYAQVT